MGWSPATFWNATPFEYSCAYIGYCKANGCGRWEVKNGWSEAMIEDHIAAVAEFRQIIPETAKVDREARAYLKEGRRGGGVLLIDV